MHFNDHFENDFDDEEFDDLAILIAFPRQQRVFRPRTDHFNWWRDHEFFDRFQLSKYTVRFLVDLISDRICSRSSW